MTKSHETRAAAAGTAITVGVSVVGGLAILGVAGAAVLNWSGPRFDLLPMSGGWVNSASYGEVESEVWDPTVYAATDGVTSIELDGPAIGAVTEFVVAYGEVEDAALAAVDGYDNPLDTWTIDTEGNALRVEMIGQFDCAPGCTGPESEQHLTLTLPLRLAGKLDLAVSAGGGDLQLGGDYATVTATVDGGSLAFEGAADALDLSVTGGSAVMTASDTGEATIDVTGGGARVVLTGAAPDLVRVDAETSHVEVALPDADYRVTSDSTASEVADHLRGDEKSKRAVWVAAAMSSVELR